MPVHRGTPAPKFAPIATTLAAQNFNENRCDIFASVNPRNTNTSVVFHWGTSPTLSTFNVVSYGNMTGNTAQTISIPLTGLVPGTTYYYRVFAMSNVDNSVGTIMSFTTWSLKTYTQTAAGSYSVSVPSVTPVGGSAIAPSIFNIAVYGGGGGANYAGGGGGGYRVATSRVSSVAGTQNVSVVVGGGGAGGNGGGGTGGAGTGGSSSLTIGNFTYTATGGGPGSHPGSVGAPSGTGGASGSGDNPSYGGGGNTYGYLYFTGNYVQVWVCTHYDKFGTCTGGYWTNDYAQPIYAWDGNYYAGGGGGGNSGAGSAAATHNTTSQVGGAGGAGHSSGYGIRGGNGGGGRGTQGVGNNGSVGGSGTIVGTGGQGWFGAGLSGGVTFQYYGP